MRGSIASWCLFLLFCSISYLFGQNSPFPVPITFSVEQSVLQGKFYAASGEGSFQTVLLMHGFPGNENDVLGLCRKLAESGINGFTFNVRGTHQSEGEFSFQNSLVDMYFALAFLHQNEVVERFDIDTTRIIIGGHSFGGGISLIYAANHPRIKRVISIAGTDHATLTRKYQQEEKFRQMLDSQLAELNKPKSAVRFKKFPVMEELIENINTYDLRRNAPNLKDKKILLIGGWDDRSVTIEDHLLPFYRTLKKQDNDNVRFIAYQTNHSFENVRDQLARDVISWIMRE